MRALLMSLSLVLVGCAPYAQRPDLPALTDPSLPEMSRRRGKSRKRASATSKLAGLRASMIRC